MKYHLFLKYTSHPERLCSSKQGSVYFSKSNSSDRVGMVFFSIIQGQIYFVMNMFFESMRAKLSWLVIGLLCLSAAACDDDDDSRTSAKSEEVEEAVGDGTWQVTYFFDDTDETSDFNEYVFTFTSDGSVQAVSANDIIDGTWSTRASGDSGAKLIIDFEGDTDPFDEISEDWNVTEYSETELVLRDVSGGSGEVDYLTFTKIL
jgi:hypothetical protein